MWVKKEWQFLLNPFSLKLYLTVKIIYFITAFSFFLHLYENLQHSQLVLHTCLPFASGQYFNGNWNLHFCIFCLFVVPFPVLLNKYLISEWTGKAHPPPTAEGKTWKWHSAGLSFCKYTWPFPTPDYHSLLPSVKYKEVRNTWKCEMRGTLALPTRRVDQWERRFDD